MFKNVLKVSLKTHLRKITGVREEIEKPSWHSVCAQRPRIKTIRTELSTGYGLHCQ